MIVHVYCIVRNEALMLPYFFRHYDKFTSEYFIYDDNSDDGTREIVQANPKAHLCPVPLAGLDDVMFAELYRDEYRKRSRGKADWCMALAADEFIYHKGDVMDELEFYAETGYDLLRAQGFQMIADHPPELGIQIYQEIKTGVPDARYSLAVIFNPLIDVEFGPGREQTIYPRGARIAYESSLRLLHYRFLGEDYIRERHARNYARLTEKNKAMGYGTHTAPDYAGEYDLEWFRIARKGAKPCLG